MYVLKLENICDDQSWFWNKHGFKFPKPWVAEIKINGKKISRKFLKLHKDYREANSKGSRGIFSYFVLSENIIYEINDLQTKRYFAVVNNNKVSELNRKEVEEWQKDNSI